MPTLQPCHVRWLLEFVAALCPTAVLAVLLVAGGGGGWLSLKMQRLRRRLRLPQHVTLYGLRHRYGLMGIKDGVNLKLFSLCMGHARTQMTEHYIAEAGLTEQVQRAALQVAYGPGPSRENLHEENRLFDRVRGPSKSDSKPKPEVRLARGTLSPHERLCFRVGGELSCMNRSARAIE
jgi:hypothetical protein